MKLMRIALVAGLLGVSFSAHADFWGTLSGRSANPANNPQLSVEGSFTTGGDYQNIGARINYGVNESLTVYGDFGLAELNGPDGTAFGAGLFYYLPNMSDSVSFFGDKDVAIQASYHTATLDSGGFDLDTSAIGAALLVSPKTAFNPDNGMNWYANVGFTRLTVDVPRINTVFGVFGGGSESEIELQLGGGVYLPMGPGTLYAGADLIDEFIFGVGYRFGIQ
ncbi:MAG: hypothetical protein AB8B87_05105 [Granulosicoccus sp.]